MRDLLEVAEELGLELEPAGEEYRCRCQHPGHADAAPSLYLHPGKQEWYCFGCARGGTAYGLVLWMKPEISRGRALRMAAGEEGSAGLVLHTLRRLGRREDSRGEAPALFAVLMGRYAGRPVSELPRELVDALLGEDPGAALRRLVAW